MQLSHPRFMLGVFGGSGTGKTTYALRYITTAPAEAVLIFDPDGEFSHALQLPWSGTPELMDFWVKSGWLCYDPQLMFPGDNAAGLEYFSRYAYAVAGVLPGRKFFVVDELGCYTSGSDVPLPLKIIVQTGRRVGLDGVFIAHQPNELHNTIRCQLSEVVCFQITDDTALEFPQKFGFDPKEVRSLGLHQFICLNNRGGQERG